MCGRYRLTRADRLAEKFEAELAEELQPRYNIAPTQVVSAVRVVEHGKRELVQLRWGLVPSWADDLKIGYKLINARAETVPAKPAFRSAFKKRRCLIVADGYYEWQKTGAKQKQPYWLHLRDRRPFAFAGLWEHWERDGKAVDSCTIITTQANEATRPIHDRMPVVLAPESYTTWLTAQDPEALLPLLGPSPADWWTAHPVATLVNNPKNNVPECVAPLNP